MGTDTHRVSIDWEGIRTRVEAGMAALERQDIASDAAAQSIFRSRARRLAERCLEENSAEATEVWVVGVAGAENIAIRASHLRGIVQIEHLARPHSRPQGALGVVCHGGDMLTVVDLGSLMGLGYRDSVTVGDQVLLPAVRRGEVAIRIDAAVGTLSLGREELKKAAAQYVNEEHCIGGRTESGVNLVDFAAVLQRIEAIGAGA